MNHGTKNGIVTREMPVRWKTEPLKYNSYIKGRIGWQNLRSDEFIDEGPYLVTGMHFQSGKVDWSSCYHISEERYDIAPEIQLKIGDVLITKDGTIGKLAYIDELPGFATLNSHLLVIRPLLRKYNPKFLFFCLSSHDFKSYCDTNQSGTTFFGVTQEAIENFPLWLPSIPDQIAIASFLDRETGKIDALVEEQKRLIELLKEKRLAVISHIVTKGLNPDVPMKATGIEWLGEMPVHWEVDKFSRVVKIAEGQVDPEVEPYRSMPLIAPNHIESATGRLLALETAEAQGAESGKYMCRAGDVIYSKIRPALAKVTIAPVDGLCSADMYPMSSKALAHQYLLYLLLTAQFTGWSVLEADRVAMPKINRESLADLRLPVPPLDEQQGIANRLTNEVAKIDALLAEANSAIVLLQERRSALISAAVTGKIEVRGQLTTAVVTPDFRQSRKLIAAKIVEDLSGQKTFGRVKLQKLLYLAEAHGGIRELSGHYVREAAGPLDRDMVREVETALQASGHVVVEQPEGRGTAVTYHLRGTRGAFQTELESLLGDKISALSELIETVGTLDTRGAEAVATLYAVWNDALASGTVPSEDEIIREVLNDWHPKKAENFTVADLKHWLAWMRRNGLNPKGNAPVTTTGRLFV